MSQGMSSILLMVVLIVMIYFMMIRPQRKKDKEDREMRAALQVGDEIVTIGGIVGKITKINDNTIVIYTGTDRTKIEFLKTAVATVRKGEANKAEAAESKKEAKTEEEETRPNRDKKVTPKKLSRKNDSEE